MQRNRFNYVENINHIETNIIWLHCHCMFLCFRLRGSGPCLHSRQIMELAFTSKLPEGTRLRLPSCVRTWFRKLSSIRHYFQWWRRSQHPVQRLLHPGGFPEGCPSPTLGRGEHLHPQGHRAYDDGREPTVQRQGWDHVYWRYCHWRGLHRSVQVGRRC